MQFKLTAFTALLAMATLTAAAPTGGSQQSARDLEELITPVAHAVNPTTQGIAIGLAAGAGNIEAAIQNAGAAVEQAADGVADVAASTAAGLGQTVDLAPGAVVQTVHAIDNTPGVIGVAAHTVFGSRRALVAAQSA